MLALAPIAYLGRISYGIYIWHWPLIVWAEKGWIDVSGVSTVPRIIVLTTAIVAIASLSYHAVEKPIRYGTIGTHLNKKRIGLLLPALLAALIAINISVVVPHAGAEITVRTRAGANVARVTKTVILVGDSVPQALADEFADAAAERGYVVLRATAGGCPATAISKVYSSGEKFKHDTCATGDRRTGLKIKQYRPALVIWWSRYELGPRLGPHGRVLPSDPGRTGGRSRRRSRSERAC